MSYRTIGPLVTIISIYLFITDYIPQFTTPQPVYELKLLKESGIFVNVTETSRVEQCRRIRHIQEACSDTNVQLDKYHQVNTTGLTYYYSRKYNFSLCRALKAGSSIWTQIFAILKYGSSVSWKVFSYPRFAVHNILKSRLVVPFDSDERRNSRTVLVSRDPYSRLFSAFVDKMFLPGFFPKAERIVARQRNISEIKFVCPNNITFEEFLKDILERSRKGNTTDPHWAPISSVCNPCNVKAYILVKQESFGSDVEHTLKEFGIASDEFETIHEALVDHRVEATIPGMVRSVLVNSHDAKHCMNKTEVLRRIWLSLQIQGYIRDNITFPDHILGIEATAQLDTVVSSVILHTIKKYPLTPEESKIQRHRALASAFAIVSTDVLEGIMDVYKQDFMLFNYSLTPPSGRLL